jgi:hypothetical protein
MERYPAIYVPATDVFIGLPRSSYDRFVAGRDAGANLSLQDPAWWQEQFSIKMDSRGTVLEPISKTSPTLVNEGLGGDDVYRLSGASRSALPEACGVNSAPLCARSARKAHPRKNHS